MKDRKPSLPRTPTKDSALQPILTHEASLPGKIAADSDARQVLDGELVVLGAQLVTQLHILFKTVRIHDRTNAALDHILNSLMTTRRTVGGDEPVVLRLQNDFLYLGTLHLKMTRQQTSVFLEFMDTLQTWGIGAIIFGGELHAAELREWAYLMTTFDPATSSVSDLRQRMKAAQVEHIDVEEATYVTVRVDVHTKQVKELAKHLYLKAVGVVQEVVQNVRSRMTPNFRQAKRAVQNIVDLILRDEQILLGLTTLRCYDEYTHNHSVNVSLLSIALANRAGYQKGALVDVGLAALFHDLGKTSLPLELLNKPGELSAEEWTRMRQHPVEGVISLARLRGIKNLPARMAAAMFEHHMNVDLSGFPKLEAPWEVSLTGRIITIADCYDAMTSSRVYRRAPIVPEKALKMMMAKSGQAYDDVLLKLFVNCVGIIPIGSLVLLDTNELAVVMRSSQHENAAARPYVKLVTDTSGDPLDGPEVELTETDAEGQYKRSIVRLVDNTEYRFDTSRYFV